VSEQLDVGDTWSFAVAVAAGSTVSVTVTPPIGAPVVTTPEPADGVVVVEVPLAVEGRYLAAVTVTAATGETEVFPFTVWAAAPTPVPTLATLKVYLRQTSATDDEIQDALNAELDDQRSKCDIPANYPWALGQALKRRVAVNLASRNVPIAELTTFEGGTTESRVPWRDPVVMQYEAPYRKVVVG
jgi:hypothetical protein